MINANNDVSLVLSGGGAHAAYQVGFLRCLADQCPQHPYPHTDGDIRRRHQRGVHRQPPGHLSGGHRRAQRILAQSQHRSGLRCGRLESRKKGAALGGSSPDGGPVHDSGPESAGRYRAAQETPATGTRIVGRRDQPASAKISGDRNSRPSPLPPRTTRRGRPSPGSRAGTSKCGSGPTGTA